MSTDHSSKAALQALEFYTSAAACVSQKKLSKLISILSKLGPLTEKASDSNALSAALRQTCAAARELVALYPTLQNPFKLLQFEVAQMEAAVLGPAIQPKRQPPLLTHALTPPQHSAAGNKNTASFARAAVSA